MTVNVDLRSRRRVGLTTATASDCTISLGEMVVKYAMLVSTYTTVTMGMEMMMDRGRFLKGGAHQRSKVMVEGYQEQHLPSETDCTDVQKLRDTGSPVYQLL